MSNAVVERYFLKKIGTMELWLLRKYICWDQLYYMQIVLFTRTDFNQSLVCPACLTTRRCKSVVEVDNNQLLADDKGVQRELESEGSLKQNSDLRNTNHIKKGSLHWVSMLGNTKPQSYPECSL